MNLTKLWKYTTLQARLIRFRLHYPKQDLVIVTGANHTHFLSLCQFLLSVIKFEPHIPIFIYDLGLHEDQRATLETISEGLIRSKILNFDFANYPPHVNIDDMAGQYAWKPIIISEVAQFTNGNVLWCDAGNVLKKRLKLLNRIISKNGFYSPLSAGSIQQWTHPGMLDFLQTPDVYLSKRNLAGGLVGIKTDNALTQLLLQQWLDCALNVKCISPQGSSRENHRQDQSALTNIAYKLGFAQQIFRQGIGANVSAIGLELQCDIE